MLNPIRQNFCDTGKWQADCQGGCRCFASKLSMEVAGNAGSGFEFASGIPGSLGGGIFMNAGAYGGQMSDVGS